MEQSQNIQRVMLAESETDSASTSFDSARPNFRPIGSPGTNLFAGYFTEEYLTMLRGTKGAKIWDEMRRSEPQVVMLLAAVMNPIKAATWNFEAAEDESVPDAQAHADFCKLAIKELLDWDATLHEILSFLAFGYSLFEVIHSVVLDHPTFGSFNGIKALGFRSQKTVERWNFDKPTGELKSVTQYAYGDTAQVGNSTEIPAQFLLVFSLHKEGDNYEGVSFLRPMYGPYFRKNLYQKLAAIGLEKYAVGVPVGTIPAGKENSADAKKFKAVLSAITSHEAAYITKPAGWEVDIKKFDFDASKVKELIQLENTEMINAAVANFLALGMGGAGGAYALGQDLSDFFLQGIQSYANLVCGVFNRQLIPSLIKMNFGPQAAYPKLKCSGIDDNAGLEFAQSLNTLAGKEFIRPDDKLESFLRERYNLPAAEPETVRKTEPAPSFFSERRRKLSEKAPTIKLDAKYRKAFNASKDDVKEVMQANLKVVLESLKDDLRAAWKKATPSQRPKIVAQVQASGVNKYRAELKELFAEIATDALDEARKQVPSAAKIKLSEQVATMKLAAPKGGYYAALPPNIRSIIDAQSALVAQTQVADIEKVVLFQFTSSSSGTENIDEILSDLDEAALPVIEGSTASGMSVDAAASNAVANVSNQARMEFFFDPEVLEKIESFTFTNEDPQSEICQELAGTTFAANDPDVDRYNPPLHHNCKSRLIPNEKGDTGNPEIDRGGPSLSKAALKSMTLCDSCDPNRYKLV